MLLRLPHNDKDGTRLLPSGACVLPLRDAATPILLPALRDVLMMHLHCLPRSMLHVSFAIHAACCACHLSRSMVYDAYQAPLTTI